MSTESKRDRTWQEDLRQFVPGPQVLVAAVVLVGCFVWFYWNRLLPYSDARGCKPTTNTARWFRCFLCSCCGIGAT